MQRQFQAVQAPGQEVSLVERLDGRSAAQSRDAPFGQLGVFPVHLRKWTSSSFVEGQPPERAETMAYSPSSSRILKVSHVLPTPRSRLDVRNPSQIVGSPMSPLEEGPLTPSPGASKETTQSPLTLEKQIQNLTGIDSMTSNCHSVS